MLDGGVAQFKVVAGNPDSRDATLQLTLGANKATISDKDMGGTIGGLFTARRDLEPTKRELGQLAVALGDAMNQQNRLGMDLDNELGGDLFTLEGSQGLPYAGNQGSGAASVNFVPGKGSEVTTFDYEVQFNSAPRWRPAPLRPPSSR